MPVKMEKRRVVTSPTSASSGTLQVVEAVIATLSSSQIAKHGPKTVV